MKTIVRGNSIEKPVGTQSNVTYPVHEFEVGEEVNVVDRDDKILNVAKVIATDSNNVVLEMIA